MIFVHWLESYPPGTRILDVGAASGVIGRLCKEKQFSLCGIEPDPTYTQYATPYYREWVNDDLDNTPDDKISNYQVIICGDVLEHIASPEKSLQRLINLQSSTTVFFISVPNIANVWIRLNLLFGRFNYTERGILDRTHLRFFTRATFLKLLQEVGLELIDIRVTPIPLDLVHPYFYQSKAGRLLYKTLIWLTRIFPTLLGYQWVSISRRNQDGKSLENFRRDASVQRC